MLQIHIFMVASLTLPLLMTYGSILKKDFLDQSTTIHQIWCTIYLMWKENNTSVSRNYTQFKSLFYELYELQALLECICGASKIWHNGEEDRQVHLFLGGLEIDQFDHIKGSTKSGREWWVDGSITWYCKTCSLFLHLTTVLFQFIYWLGSKL